MKVSPAISQYLHKSCDIFRSWHLALGEEIAGYIYILSALLKVMIFAESLAPVDIQNARDHLETPEWAQTVGLGYDLLVQGEFGLDADARGAVTSFRVSTPMRKTLPLLRPGHFVGS